MDIVISEWILWLCVAAVLAIGEIITEGFFLAWFAIGAGVASVAAYLGLSAGWQWGLFLLTSAILLGFSRRFAEKFTKAQPPGIGADRYSGKIGVVLEEVNNLQNTGRVRIDKDEWRADSSTDRIIPTGEKVKIIGLDGTHLVVESIESIKEVE
jgi:membrane protein implicated in regulation of membrane protease activity